MSSENRWIRFHPFDRLVPPLKMMMLVVTVLVQTLTASEVASEDGRGVIMQQPRPSRLPELSSAARAAFRP